MKFFLSENIWKENRGFAFGKPITYLPPLDFHPGQDFFTKPIGTIPVMAPCDGKLNAFGFSKSAGWWGVYTFEYKSCIYSLKILHMYKAMKSGEYKEGDILGYCGATGLAISAGKTIYIGESDEEQASNEAVPHLHVELHKGEFQHDTNKNLILARKRIIDPVSTFEEWIRQKDSKGKEISFYQEEGRSSIYIKGTDNIYYPIIIGKHFEILFGQFQDNLIIKLDEVMPKSDKYFGLFKSNDQGTYDAV